MPACASAQPSDTSFESRASLFQQTAPLADPCTFRLITKNVTGLLRDSGVEASQKAAAARSLEDLLRRLNPACMLVHETAYVRSVGF